MPFDVAVQDVAGPHQLTVDEHRVADLRQLEVRVRDDRRTA